MTDARFVDRQVLITGATGVVGSWLVDALLRVGARPVVLLRDEVPGSALERERSDQRRGRTVRGELENVRLLERTIVEYEVSAIFHLGAQTQVVTADRDPFGTLEANVRGTYNLLEGSATGAKVPTVIASSDKAYGPSDSLPYLETHPLAGRGIGRGG